MNRFHMAVTLIVLGIIWGLTIPRTKIAVSTGHQPLGLIFWQLVIVTVALTVISVLRRHRPVLNRRSQPPGAGQGHLRPGRAVLLRR